MACHFLTMLFRGREMSHVEIGKKMLDKMFDELEQIRLNNNSETIRAFRKFAEKAHDPKLKEMSKPEALATIATEIAEELEVERLI